MNTIIKSELEGEGKIDYKKEIKFNKDKGEYEFFFKNKEGELLAYIVFKIVQEGFGKVQYSVGNVEHLTNANGFEHMPEFLKEVYENNGYSEKSGIKHFGEIALNEVLKYAKENHKDLEIVVVKGYEKNTPYIMNLVNRIKKKYETILEIYGPGELSICTLKI
ncbi:MAG: hypothetical protein WC850_00550 [Candidatus Gracilibacteria bacterium]